VVQTVSTENGKLLALDERSHSIDDGNTGLDEVAGIFTGRRIDRLAIHFPLCKALHGSRAVTALSQPVHDASEHLLGNTKGQGFTHEPHAGSRQGQAIGSLEDLYDYRIVTGVQDLT